MKISTLFAITSAALSGVMIGLTPHSARAESGNPTTENRPAPEFVGANWLNTPGNAPLTLMGQRGKVTIVHFWTFSCINCKHNQPSYTRWQKRFAGKNVTIIGVHTPETAYERSQSNIVREVKRQGITYPILLDTQGANWNRWAQQYWPTVYLLDKQGRIRYRWEGELEYDNAGGEAQIARLVDQLLKEG